MYVYVQMCGEDFYWLWSFNAEGNESAVGDKNKRNASVGPWAGPLWAPLGPYGPRRYGPRPHGRGPYGPPWALMGWAFMGLPGL